jgi:hypothetical protein
VLPQFPYKRAIEVEVYQIEPMIHHAQQLSVRAKEHLIRQARDPDVDVSGVMVALHICQRAKYVYLFRPERPKNLCRFLNVGREFRRYTDQV